MSIELATVDSNSHVENELTKRLAEVGSAFNSDVVTIFAPMFAFIEPLVRGAIEYISTNSISERRNLSVILETDGGSIEVVERIANLLRHFYCEGEINFIVPDRAMSAGTVLVMCGDNIYMDYFSVLGPIDPQIRTADDSRYVSAMGYLDKYEELIEKSRKDELTTAELAFLLQKFDPAVLDSFRKAGALSKDLLVEWLTKYKFKNWTKTASEGKKVTEIMKRRRAAKIYKQLNDTKTWKSHLRGISMSVLQEKVELRIEDFGADRQKDSAIRSYYGLLQDYMTRLRSDIVIHSDDNILKF